MISDHYIHARIPGLSFFLDNEKGIHIFNGMGDWIKTISVQDLTLFQFSWRRIVLSCTVTSSTSQSVFSRNSAKYLSNQPFKIALLRMKAIVSAPENIDRFFSNIKPIKLFSFEHLCTTKNMSIKPIKLPQSLI